MIEPKKSLADNTKAKEELGWNPTTNVIEWLKNDMLNKPE